MIVEPVAGNMGVVPPAPGFLETLREETRRAGALLIFDEVITGFRVGWGGAQERYGVTPDLTCLGKIIGGGLPLAAFGGRRDLMEQLAPVGPVYQAGTLSGNPLSGGRRPGDAADASEPRRTPTSGSSALGARAEAGLREALAATGARGCVNRVGSMLTLFLGVERVRDFTTATTRRHAGLRPLLPRDAGRGRLPAAVAVRGDVRLAGPHRGDIDRLVDCGPAGPGRRLS